MVLDGHKGEKMSGIEWLHDGDSNAFFFTSGIQFIALGIASDGKISLSVIVHRVDGKHHHVD
mgnify:FL=1